MRAAASTTITPYTSHFLILLEIYKDFMQKFKIIAPSLRHSQNDNVGLFSDKTATSYLSKNRIMHAAPGKPRLSKVVNLPERENRGERVCVRTHMQRTKVD